MMIRWSYNERKKTLTISGSGDIDDFFGDDDTIPWLERRVVIEEGVTSVGKGAFRNCHALRSVKMPRSITSIGERAFNRCGMLGSLTIPEGVTNIGAEAFFECSSLTTVTIPEGVTAIGDRAFCGCKNLRSVIIPDSVVSIGHSAFSGCAGLRSVKISKNISGIGDYVFSGCGSLRSVNIPDGVTSVGKGAFEYCQSLRYLTVPGSVRSIAPNAFYSTLWIKKTLRKKRLAVINGLLIEADTKIKGDVVIPDNVTEIGERAFSVCKKITSVKIPDSVVNIGKEAFYGCAGLVKADISENVTSIGDKAFHGTPWLKTQLDKKSIVTAGRVLIAADPEKCEGNITIPGGIVNIGENAFSGCRKLKSVTMPDSVAYIGKNVFDGCDSLKFLRLLDSGGSDFITFLHNEDVPFQKQFAMVREKNYETKIKTEVKYDLLWQLFKKGTGDKDLLDFIEKNFVAMMFRAIDRKDAETVSKVCDYGKFLTEKNIDTLIDHAIDMTQNGGSLEIQIILSGYKNKKFGFRGSDFIL